MSRTAVIPVALALLSLSGCGAAEGQPQHLPAGSNGACSELTRAVARWQNRETDACGGAQVEMRTLIPIPGHARFMIWTPVDRSIDTWTLGGDETLGSEPTQISTVPPGGSNLIAMALGEDRAVIYNQQNGNLDVWKLDLDADHGAKTQLATHLFKRAWLAPKPGRDLIALDETYFLDLRPGTGDYSIVAFDRQYQSEDVDPFDTHVGGSGRKDAFQRGHRLVALPQSHRVLEWVPARHEYRVWSYDLGRLPGDIFDDQPVAEGSGGIWSSLGAENELVSLSSHRLAVWNRTSGTLETHALDALAQDPVDVAPLGATRHDRLRSLMPGALQPARSNIRRMVLVFPQGRSFDALFGGECQAEPGSNPTCEHDLTCCERMPTSTVGATAPSALGSDGDAYVPNQSFPCMWEKMNGGAMNQFASASSGCGDPRAFARLQPASAEDPLAGFRKLAAQGTLGDRFFTSIANVTVDPALLNVLMFGVTALRLSFSGNQGEDSIGILAANAKLPWALYLTDPTTTTFGYPEPLYFDGRWAFFRYLEELPHDAALGQLPQVSVVIPYAGDPAAVGQPATSVPPNDPRAGAAGSPDALARSAALISGIADAVAASPYAEETLIVVAYLTTGGFYDHVAPPRLPAMGDAGGGFTLAYGPRAPFLAIGPFVRKGGVSHAALEISSLTAFIEWNWLGGRTGQLDGRDRTVGNLGGLLLPETTGVPVP